MADSPVLAAGGGRRGLLARLLPFWPLLIILGIAAVAIFTNLGRDRLWADEGDTAVLAANILKYGVPRAWDGTTLIAPDGGQRINDSLVMVSHPWVQYYAAAASLALFGHHTFAARLPFALGGLATIALLYGCVYWATRRHLTAAIAAMLLTASVQFLLYARQARNYSLSMALTCAMVLIFWRLTTRRAAVAFAIVAILAFHTSPTAWAPCAALGVLTLVASSCRPYRRRFWQTAPFVALGTVPWVFLAASGYGANTAPLVSLARLWPRSAQFLIEYASITPVLAVVACWIVFALLDRRGRPLAIARAHHKRSSARTPAVAAVQGWSAGERMYFVTLLAVGVAYGIMLVSAESVDNLFVAGLRYAAPLIPLTMGAAALCIARIARRKPALVFALAALLIVTNVGRLIAIAPMLAPLDDDAAGTPSLHVPITWQASLMRSSLLSYATELRRDNPGTVAGVASFLRAHAGPQDVVITNYEWEPLYFHTGLPQGLKMTPLSPAYVNAKRQGLPDFVFSVVGAKWVVWRWAWDGYMGNAWSGLSQRFAAAGGRLVKVAEVPETVWENRENIYFHRFAPAKYLYRQSGGESRPAEIYRVEWPNGHGPGTALP